MKTFLKLSLIFILCQSFGCNTSPNNEATIARDSSMDVGVEKMEMARQAAPSQDIEVERKLIKQGNLAYEVNDLKASRAHILETCTKYQAYISSDNEYKSSNEQSLNFNIRVPAENFDNLVNEITTGVELFDQKQISVSDVTEEFLDITARLSTKKALEQRYKEILKQAKSVTDILEVERQMNTLRADIESIEGRLKYLENQVGFSSLDIRIYKTFTKQTAFSNKFSQGFKNGWQNLIWFFVFLVNIWPFILLLALVFVFLRLWVKRDKKPKKS